jgi:hypothetical protein
MPEVDSFILALVVTTALAVAYYSPFLTMKKLRRAAATNNSKALAEILDAPSIQIHLRERLTSLLATKKDENGRPSSLAAHAAGVAGAWAPAQLALSTTPEGMFRILQGLHPTPHLQESVEEVATPVIVSAKYESLNRFSVTTRNINRDTQTEITLSRRGLFSWKVIDIALP